MPKTHHPFILFIMVQILISHSLLGQKEKKEADWRLGRVTLKSGEVKEGKLAYHRDVLLKNTDLVWLQGLHYHGKTYASYHLLARAKLLVDDGKEKVVYDAQAIRHFELFPDSSSSDASLLFITLLMPKPRVNNHPFFFQVIAKGKLTLLKQTSVLCKEEEKLLNQQTLESLASLHHDKANAVLIKNYYVLDKDTNQLMLITTSKQSILKHVMSNQKKTIKAFIKHEGLNLTLDEDLKKLFDYYNRDYSMFRF